MNHGKLSEKLKFDAEVLDISSASGATSILYDMRGYQQAFVSFAINGDFTTVVVDLMESSAATAAGTSAAGGKAGIVVGGVSTLISSTGGVREFTLTMTSATAESFYLTAGTVGPKMFTYGTSTALNTTASTAWTSTLAYFGSTVGTTVNTGIQLSIDNLKTAIDHQFGVGVFNYTSGTTASLGILLADQDKTGVGFQSTNAFYSAAINQAVGGFNIDADQLTSTANKRYVAIKVATAVTACDVGVSVCRSGSRFGSPVFVGKLSS